MTERTFFGLEVVSGRGVRTVDIASLPFADFWSASAVGSGQLQDRQSGEWLVHLHDWREFSLLFIATGRHRHMPRPAYVQSYGILNERGRTYFGLEIVENLHVRKTDIANLPFFAFWDEQNPVLDTASALDGSEYVQLDAWKKFARRFIETG